MIKGLFSDLERRLFVMCTLAQPIFNLSGNDSSKRIQRYPQTFGLGQG